MMQFPYDMCQSIDWFIGRVKVFTHGTKRTHFSTSVCTSVQHRNGGIK